MAKPHKESLPEKIFQVVQDALTMPLTDESSAPPTAADVRRVKAAVGGPLLAPAEKARIPPKPVKKRVR